MLSSPPKFVAIFRPKTVSVVQTQRTTIYFTIFIIDNNSSTIHIKHLNLDCKSLTVTMTLDRHFRLLSLSDLYPLALAPSLFSMSPYILSGWPGGRRGYSPDVSGGAPCHGVGLQPRHLRGGPKTRHEQRSRLGPATEIDHPSLHLHSPVTTVQNAE